MNEMPSPTVAPVGTIWNVKVVVKFWMFSGVL